MAALDADTGQLLWKTFMVPSGYTGGAVWGSTPAIDAKRGQLYIATGNNYSIPQSALDCIAAAGTDPEAHSGPVSPPTTSSTRSWRSTCSPGRSAG